jgi:ABC-type multidrug transport system ATPase subunit
MMRADEAVEDAAAPSRAPAAVYLEWRDISVALKSRGEGKPPPIDTTKMQAKVLQRVGLFIDPPLAFPAPQGPCSTVSPPILDFSLSSIPSLPTFSPQPHSATPPSGGNYAIHASFSPTPSNAAFRNVIHSPPPFSLPFLNELPIAPEFSFLRGCGEAREVASEPMRKERKEEEKVMKEEENDTPQQPVMVFHSQPESSLKQKDDELAVQLPFLPPLPPSQERPKKLILNSISGYALPGQLLAIMGCSGAGKSTLLNVLSGRYASSTAKVSAGAVMINGGEVPWQKLSKQSKVVQQNDLLLPVMTVRELLLFAAVMKLPESVTEQERQGRVNEVIRELGLTKCQHFLVGSSGAGDGDSGGSSGASSGDGGGGAEDDESSAPVSASGTGTGVSRSGISGGEQRRVSIGLELVSDPQLLFLDGE